MFRIFTCELLDFGIEWVRIELVGINIAPTGSNFQRSKHFVGDFGQKSMDLVDEWSRFESRFWSASANPELRLVNIESIAHLNSLEQKPPIGSQGL